MSISSLPSDQNLHVCNTLSQPNEVLCNPEIKKVDTVANRSLDNFKENLRKVNIASPQEFKKMPLAEALGLLENIEAKHSYDNGVLEVCNEIRDLCRKSEEFYLEKDALLSDKTISEELKENTLFVLAGMYEKTAALRTPEQLAKRFLSKNIPLENIQEGVLVYDVTGQRPEGYTMPLSEFKDVLEREKKSQEDEIMRLAFEQKYVQPVKESLQEAFSNIRDSLNRVTRGFFLVGISLVGIGLCGKLITKIHNH